MKYKYLIIAFIIIIIIAILVIVFLPWILFSGNAAYDAAGNAGAGFDAEFALNFRYLTFPLLIFMALLLACMSMVFFLNYRLFSLLEREDWPALAYYLEQKIYVKNRYSNRYVRLLASSYLVISDFPSVIKLESKTLLKKPSLIGKNALLFGSARVLGGGNYVEAAAFFRSHMNKGRSRDKQWLHWFHGFTHLLSGSFTQAEAEFSPLALTSDDALISGLSAYFLHTSLAKFSLRPDKCLELAVNGKERVIKALKNIDGWKNELDRVGTNIHIAIIRRYIEEAGNWIFFDKLPVVAAQEDRRKTDRRKAERRAGNRGSEDRRKNNRRGN